MSWDWSCWPWKPRAKQRMVDLSLFGFDQGEGEVVDWAGLCASGEPFVPPPGRYTVKKGGLCKGPFFSNGPWGCELLWQPDEPDDWLLEVTNANAPHGGLNEQYCVDMPHIKGFAVRGNRKMNANVLKLVRTDWADIDIDVTGCKGTSLYFSHSRESKIKMRTRWCGRLDALDIDFNNLEGGGDNNNIVQVHQLQQIFPMGPGLRVSGMRMFGFGQSMMHGNQRGDSRCEDTYITLFGGTKGWCNSVPGNDYAALHKPQLEGVQGGWWTDEYMETAQVELVDSYDMRFYDMNFVGAMTKNIVRMNDASAIFTNGTVAGSDRYSPVFDLRNGSSIKTDKTLWIDNGQYAMAWDDTSKCVGKPSIGTTWSNGTMQKPFTE